ncbi:MAG: hypothetical protein ACFFG0_37625 [Candidatus Thorarchaeota archaeon]
MVVESLKQHYEFAPSDGGNLGKSSNDQFIELLLKNIRPQHRARARNKLSFIYSGKVLDEYKSLNELGVHHKAVITVMSIQKASSDRSRRDVNDPIYIRLIRRFISIINEYLNSISDFGTETLKTFLDYVDSLATRMILLSYPIEKLLAIQTRLRSMAERRFTGMRNLYSIRHDRQQ